MDLGSIVALIIGQTGWTIEYTLGITFEQAIILINFWTGKKPTETKEVKKISDIEMFAMSLGKQVIKK